MSSGFASGNDELQDEPNQLPDHHHHHHLSSDPYLSNPSSDQYLFHSSSLHTLSATTTTSTSAADMHQQEVSFEPPFFGPAAAFSATRAAAAGGFGFPPVPFSSHDMMMVSSSSFDQFQPFSSSTNNMSGDPSPFLFPPHSSSYAQPTNNLFSIRPHAAAAAAAASSSTSAFHHHFGGGAYLDGGASVPSSSDPLRILSEALHHGQLPGGPTPFGLQVQAELNKLTAQEIMDAKALAASRSHSEAERRRRERINNHLAKLRSLLPNTTKTDKASLLAEVIQHVKELKRQTSHIAETSTIPTESDELTVDTELMSSSLDGGRMVIKASLCCDDRSDLLPDLIKALKSLRLKTLKAEITTLGGRVKNVLFVTGENDENDDPVGNNNNNNNMMMIADNEQIHQCTLNSIQLALKSVLEKSSGGDDSASGNAKRQRTNTATPTSS